MKILIQISILCCLTLLGIDNARAQANYWNIGGTYFNCNTGAVATTTPTLPTDVYADAFYVPGLCSTYYRVSWVNISVPHANALVITDISANPSGHPFDANGDQDYLINDGTLHSAASVAVAPIDSTGTRKIYATYDNLIKSWTVNANGTVSGPTTLYTYPAGTAFDSRTATEVSSDGKYLLINAYENPAGSVILFNLATNTPTNYPMPYPSPGGFVTGYEYVTGWSTNPRIYVSYNTMWLNPSGTGGFGYYDLGNTTTFNNITAGPSGTDIRGFGFSDMEKAKNGKLYFVYNPTLSISISNAGTLYSYSSTGVWAAVSGISVPATNNNWSYYLQTQIDGENYDVTGYAAPTVTSLKLNETSGGTTPATAAQVFRCPSGLKLNAGYAGLLGSKSMTISVGTISGGVFTAGTSFPYSQTNAIDTLSESLALINTTLGNDTGAFMIQAFATGPCGNQTSITRYFKVQNVSVLASYSKPGCISLGFPCGLSLQTTLPITTPPPAPNSLIATFRTHVDSAKGYMGAGNCGMYGINTNGSWSVNVYQVNSTGGRMIIGADTAPIVFHLTGYGAASGVTYFSQNALAYDQTNPPFYYDPTSNYGDGSYFKDFYTSAKSNGTLVSDYGTRVFAAELIVTDTVSHCSDTNKSYFKIAIDSTFSNGSNARPGPDGNESEDLQALVYPNPTKSMLIIAIPFGATGASLQLMDNTGRILLENDHLNSGKNTINVQQLSSGVYFYRLSFNGIIQHGKIIRQ